MKVIRGFILKSVLVNFWRVFFGWPRKRHYSSRPFNPWQEILTHRACANILEDGNRALQQIKNIIITSITIILNMLIIRKVAGFVVKVKRNKSIWDGAQTTNFVCSLYKTKKNSSDHHFTGSEEKWVKICETQTVKTKMGIRVETVFNDKYIRTLCFWRALIQKNVQFEVGIFYDDSPLAILSLQKVLDFIVIVVSFRIWLFINYDYFLGTITIVLNDSIASSYSNNNVAKLCIMF